MSDEPFLSRWSRLKRATEAAPERSAPPARPAASTPAVSPTDPVPLPPVESLTPESDFTPFMRAEVDPGLRRSALKKLFADPQFNVMDGLDVYIDDYSKPDPLPEGWLEKMNQVARLGAFVEKVEEAPKPDEAPVVIAQEGDTTAALEPPREAPQSDTSVEDTTPVPVRKS